RIVAEFPDHVPVVLWELSQDDAPRKSSPKHAGAEGLRVSCYWCCQEVGSLWHRPRLTLQKKARGSKRGWPRINSLGLRSISLALPASFLDLYLAGFGIYRVGWWIYRVKLPLKEQSSGVPMQRTWLVILLLFFLAGCRGTSKPSGSVPMITTTSLPSGAINTAYSATADESGGVAPFTWSLASGSFPPGLSLASSTSNSVSISGTPTASGIFTFALKVVDSTGASVVSSSVAITVADNANDSLLTGNYAFEFSGFNSAGATVVTGSFSADGKGNLTGGVEDSDSIQGPPKNQAFTGSYTLG